MEIDTKLEIAMDAKAPEGDNSIKNFISGERRRCFVSFIVATT
jgi:hypothetical protein